MREIYVWNNSILNAAIKRLTLMRVNAYAWDSQLGACPHDPRGDFTAVGCHYLFEGPALEQSRVIRRAERLDLSRGLETPWT